MTRALALGLVTLAGAGCGVLTHARPTPKGTVALEASAGGPIVDIGAPVPLPLSTLSVSVGVLERLDVQAHVHLTTLLALRTAGLDVGTTWLPLTQDRWRPAVAITGRGFLFTDLRGAPLGFVELTSTASWLAAGRFLTLVTLSGLVDLSDGFVHWSPGLGEQVLLGHWALGLDLRWYDPTYDVRFSSAKWAHLGGRGALGLVLGASYRFGGE